MFAWLSRWGKDTKTHGQGNGRAAASEAAPIAPTPDAARAEAAAPAPMWATHADTLAWALGMAVPLPADGTQGEASGTSREALRAVDAVLARTSLPADLLPRAPAVIPQLLSLLRQDDLPLPRIVERVVRDPLLTTEVMRLARSPHYRTRHRIETLEGAVTVLGAAGLQSAIARVVLRPLFRGDAAGLLGQAAERGWQHASRQAEVAADLAGAHGLPRFEGFLAGLLHGSGRTALWRILDGSGAAPPLPWEPALCAALAARSHRLFGQLALEWRITSTLTAAGEALRQSGASSSRSAGPAGPAQPALPPLAALVLESELLCTQELAELSR